MSWGQGVDENDEGSGSDKQQQRQSTASETDADVGPWQPKVLAEDNAAEMQSAAGASSISLPAHVQVRRQCCSGSMSSPSAGFGLCSRRNCTGKSCAADLNDMRSAAVVYAYRCCQRHQRRKQHGIPLCRRRWRCCSSPAARCHMSQHGASSLTPSELRLQASSNITSAAAFLNLVVMIKMHLGLASTHNCPDDLMLNQRKRCRLAGQGTPLATPGWWPMAVHRLCACAADIPAASEEHIRRCIHQGLAGQGRVGAAQRGERRDTCRPSRHLLNVVLTDAQQHSGVDRLHSRMYRPSVVLFPKKRRGDHLHHWYCDVVIQTWSALLPDCVMHGGAAAHADGGGAAPPACRSGGRRQSALRAAVGDLRAALSAGGCVAAAHA